MPQYILTYDWIYKVWDEDSLEFSLNFPNIILALSLKCQGLKINFDQTEDIVRKLICCFFLHLY